VIVVGVDPHKKSHTAVAVCAATGQVVGQRMVAASEAGHRALAGWIIGLDHARVAIEDVRNVSGRLERALIESGLEVVRVPPRLMGQSRRAARQRGKSDPIDAAAVARAALADPELAAGRLAGAELELHLLVSHRDDLVAERTRTQARLRWHLHALGIGLAVPPRALERALWLDRIADALAQRAEVRARVAAELVAECRRSSRRVRALEREIAQLVRQQAPELLQIPGCGPLTAAKIVGQVAGLERFASPAQLARYAGVAPVPATASSTAPSTGSRSPRSAVTRRHSSTSRAASGKARAPGRRDAASSVTWSTSSSGRCAQGRTRPRPVSGRSGIDIGAIEGGYGSFGRTPAVSQARSRFTSGFA
jgi:transposase